MTSKEANGRKKTERIIETKPYDSTTLNTWLGVLSTISVQMTREHELLRDPCVGLRPFVEDAAYQPNAPNALSPERNEIGEFLARMKLLYPQHYAISFLGFAIGHRPSTLRPPASGSRTSFNEDGSGRSTCGEATPTSRR